MNRLSKQHFWEWFKKNNAEYKQLNNKSKKEVEYWMNELKAHLRAYFKCLEFSLALDPNGTNNLTITANGKAKYFAKVEAMINIAPEIDGWRFIALDQPMPIDFFLAEQIKEAGILPQEFSFSFVDNDPQGRDINVYHPLHTGENQLCFHRLAEGAIYNLVGERSFATDIEWIYVTNLSTAHESEEIWPIEELPARLGLLKSSSMVVDDSGRLVNITTP